MNLTDKLGQDYIAAYKAKDSVRLSVLRLIKTAMTNRLVELKQPGGTLSDAEVLDIIVRQAKQRKESIGEYDKAGRADMAAKEQAELAILEQYLPAQLSAQELEQAILAAIEETGASGKSQMGKVISLIMARYKGQVDGKEVSRLVAAKLA